MFRRDARASRGERHTASAGVASAFLFALLAAFLTTPTPSDAAKKPTPPAPEFARAIAEAERLLAERQPKRHELENAARRLDRLQKKAPKTVGAAHGLVKRAELLERRAVFSRRDADWEEAAAAFERAAKAYPGGARAPNAWLAAGGIAETRLKSAIRARAAYEAIVEGYPDSDAVSAARAGLARLGAAPLPAAAVDRTPERLEDAIRELTERAMAEAEDGLPAAPAIDGAARVSALRSSSSSTYTRVVVDLTGPVRLEHRLLKADPAIAKPPRFYMDLRPARLAPEARDVEIQDGLLQRVRAAQHDAETVRVVIDIDSISRHSVLQVDNPPRVVVDVWGAQGRRGEAPGAVAAAPGAPPGKGGAARPAGRAGGKGVLVVIDAGHGGKDPGAIGHGGLREKDVTLALAKRVAERLERLPNVRTRLTRDRDVFLELDERTAIANKLGADLFLSLHCNAAHNRAASGMETYYMDNTTDKAARKIANRENALSRRAMDDLQLLFHALRIDSNVAESSRLAESVQAAMAGSLAPRYAPLPDLGVKKALFFVLFNADMPAVLVESAFVTNAQDARRLRSGKFLDEMADAIAQGVRNYLRDAPAATLTAGG